MKDTNKPITHEKKQKPGKYRFALILILALVVIAVIVCLFKSCSGDKAPDTPSSGIAYDDNAVEGGWDEADTDEIVASLNEKVDEGMINISMNTSPIFANGSSSGNLMIVNETINRYPQVVEIVRSDTGETIYKSGAVPVGKKIEEAKLDACLAKGEYECTAMFYNVNPDTGEYLGCAGAVITVTVPREQIAFIHEANTEVRKKELFAKVRSGQVRVLMGSTFKMGAGMNVQDRLVALHDLDCPWRPGDVGRILRTFKIKKNVEVTDNGKIII